MLNFKKLQWLVLLPAIAFICQSCRNCRSDELPVLRLTIQFQEDDLYTLSSNLVETRQILNNETLQLPLALHSDTTIYDVFNRSGQRWRLAIAYDRTTDFEDTRCGFFLDFRNVRVLPEPALSNIAFEDNRSMWNVWLIE